MSLTTQAEPSPAAYPGADCGSAAVPAELAALKESAALEFHATLQLLAERARFLTGAAGVAIALEEQQQIVYTAAIGSLVAEIGAIPDVAKYPARVWQTTGEIRHAVAEHSEGANPDIAVAVLKDEKLVGFFEIASGSRKFEDADLFTVARLAAMVGTALDLREAAEQSPATIPAVPREAPKAVPATKLWHAPERPAAGPAPARSATFQVPADVHPCTGCGFPVSGARTKCVDCDAHWDEQPPALVPLSELFRVEKEESWIEAHGYTVATVLVSALTAAIIYWLR